MFTKKEKNHSDGSRSICRKGYVKRLGISIAHHGYYYPQVFDSGNTEWSNKIILFTKQLV